MLKEEKEIYLLGDFNRDLLSNQVNKAWTDYMEPFGLFQIVTQATRETTESKTLIDHIYANCPENVKPVLVDNLYWPPNSSIQWNDFFENCLEKVLKEEKEIYLLGDFNRDLLSNQVNKAWTDYMEPFGLFQIVTQATRETTESKTLIDHIYANCPENVNSIK